MLSLYYLPFLILLARDKLARAILASAAYNGTSMVIEGTIATADASARKITMAIIGYTNNRKRIQP